MSTVLQVKISLQGIEPPIWRRVQLSDSCSFWDLHCAITDAFGWLDYHIHQFTIQATGSDRKIHFGIPDDEGFDDLEILSGRDHRLSDYFTTGNPSCRYIYDFGDEWEHTVTLEEILPAAPNVDYPRCIAGERACPPEDVGGAWGYASFLKTISYKNAPDHEAMLEWCGGWFDPEWLDISLIQFGDPDVRWSIGFEGATALKTLRTVQYHRMKRR